jgi:hypothetical protein
MKLSSFLSLPIFCLVHFPSSFSASLISSINSGTYSGRATRSYRRCVAVAVLVWIDATEINACSSKLLQRLGTFMSVKQPLHTIPRGCCAIDFARGRSLFVDGEKKLGRLVPVSKDALGPWVQPRCEPAPSRTLGCPDGLRGHMRIHRDANHELDPFRVSTQVGSDEDTAGYASNDEGEDFVNPYTSPIYTGGPRQTEPAVTTVKINLTRSLGMTAHLPSTMRRRSL